MAHGRIETASLPGQQRRCVPLARDSDDITQMSGAQQQQAVRLLLYPTAAGANNPGQVVVLRASRSQAGDA